MNEKIKQLAEQADAYAHLTGEGMMYQKTRERYTEKFAELIIRECAIFSMVITDDHYDVDALYKHFGVEE